jgi:hypothetical protein
VHLEVRQFLDRYNVTAIAKHEIQVVLWLAMKRAIDYRHPVFHVFFEFGILLKHIEMKVLRIQFILVNLRASLVVYMAAVNPKPLPLN